MPWSEEEKDEVRRRLLADSGAMDARRQSDLGLVDRNPELWKGIDSYSEDGPNAHESFRNAVRLYNGGPLMQYEGRDSGGVLCYWVEKGNIVFGDYDEEQIVYVEQEEDLDS